jgi:hypothetical protein
MRTEVFVGKNRYYLSGGKKYNTDIAKPKKRLKFGALLGLPNPGYTVVSRERRSGVSARLLELPLSSVTVADEGNSNNRAETPVTNQNLDFNDDFGSFDEGAIDLNYPSNQPISDLIYNPQEFQTQFEFVFRYDVGGIRQTPHMPTDSIQIHTIQDFDYDALSGVISYPAKLVVVGLILIEFTNGALIVTACSACSSFQNLQLFMPIGSCSHMLCPGMSIERFISCKHSASVVSELCDQMKIPTLINMQEKHNILATYLKTGGKSIKPGWQNLGPCLRIGKHHQFACFLTNEYHLLSFNVSRAAGSEKILFSCNSCKRRNCSHCKVAGQQEYPEVVTASATPQNISKERHTLYSTLPYSIDYGGFSGDFSPERSDCVHDVIRSRASKGSSYFDKFPNKILSQSAHSFETCCLNQKIGILSTLPALIFSPEELVTDAQTTIYHCLECKRTFHIEGREIGLLNFSDKYFFCVELFYSLLDLKYRSGLSTYAWWNTKIEIYSRLMEENDRLVWRNKLVNISGYINSFFIQFLKLVEYPKSVMKCCGGSPEIITLDGIVMSIESKKIREANLSQPWISGFTSLSNLKGPTLIDNRLGKVGIY